MRVICPACGCNLELVPGGPVAVVGCPDCGKLIDLRKFADPTPVAPPSVDFQPPPVTRPRPRPRRSWPVPVAVFTGLAAAAVAVVVANRPADVPPPPPVPAWDVAHHGHLLALKSTADRAADRHEWRSAYDGYGNVLALALGHEVTDPATAATLREAKAGQDRAFVALAAAPPEVPAGPAPSTRDAAPAGRVAIAQFASPLPAPTTAPHGPDVSLGSSATQPGTTPAVPPAPLDPADATRLAADTAPPLATPPPAPALHAYTLPDAVSDAAIGNSIDGAVAWLRRRAGARTSVPGQGGARRRRVMPGGRPGPAGTGDDNRETPVDDGGNLGLLPQPTNVPRPPRRFGRGPWDGFDRGTTDMGTGALVLATYALLHAGQATSKPGLGANDPAVVGSLEQIKTFDLDTTYTRSLRAAALAVYNRTEDRACLESDVRWLVAAQRQGGYTYGMPAGSALSFDNSNSQYGLLGVWSGAQAGIAVGGSYWQAVAGHWIRYATPAGTWGYSGLGDTPYLSMTLAGVASLLVSHDYLDAAAENSGTARPPAHTPALDQGLDWLDQGDNAIAGIGDAQNGFASYTTYGLERVGLASGYKYFGPHDWYAELARRLVGRQAGDGSWSDRGGGFAGMVSESLSPVIDTSYYLLFLARGRHPVLYNKLRYDGDWSDRPHDVAHLARFAAKQLERPLNWQVVNLRRNWFEWMDAPVLYISGDRAPRLTEHDYVALRDFALGGGLIFTHADGGSPAFSAWVRHLVDKEFHRYELMRVPADHPLNSVVFRLKDPPPLEVVNNGSRILLVHSPTDVANGWQLNWSDARRADFELGLNVFVYAAGKADLKNRLSSPYVPQPPREPDVVRPVVRLRYAGDWDPEPYAWTRFGRVFQWQTHHGVDVQSSDLGALSPGQAPLAVLTGAQRQDFTPAEAAAVRAYVAAGGVLLIDACGGAAAFDKSIRTTLLPAAFPEVRLAPLPPDHPLLLASRPYADDLRRLPLRPFASEASGSKDVPLEGLRCGRGWVIYSRLDLTTGLLGTESWGINGYQPAYAAAVAKNALLWADARNAAPAR